MTSSVDALSLIQFLNRKLKESCRSEIKQENAGNTPYVKKAMIY